MSLFLRAPVNITFRSVSVAVSIIAFIALPCMASLAQSNDGSAATRPVAFSLKDLPPPVKVPAIFRKGTIVAEPRRHFTTFDASAGLALSSVARIYPDRDGNLWMSTTGGGISRFDGKEFLTYNVNHGLGLNVVRGVAQDSLGNFWFATQGGLSHFDGLRFKTFTNSDGLGSDLVYDVAIDNKGRIWAGTYGGGVSVFFNGKFTTFSTLQGLSSNFVRCLYQDSEDRVWIGTAQGVSVMKDEKFLSFREAPFLANSVVFSITSDRQDNLWFATSNGLVRKNSQGIRRFTTSDGLPDNLILSLKEDRNGILWVGTHEGGVCRYDGKKFQVFNVTTGLPNNRVWSIAEDKNGAMWFATQGGGVCRYEGEALTLFDATQGLIHSKVWVMRQDKEGYVWIGTDRGVSRFDGREFDNLLLGDTQQENLINSIALTGKRNIWFGTVFGAVHYDGKNLYRYTTAQGLPDNSVRKIIVANDSSVWFATLSGIAQMKNDSIFQYATPQGLVHNNVRSLLQDKTGRIWITTSGGISYFDGKTFRNVTTKDGIASNLLTRMVEDRAGNVWFGTHGAGLIRYDGSTFMDVGKSKGIPDGVIYELAIDHNDDIWAGTNQGLIKLYFRNGTEILHPGRLESKNSDVEKYTAVWEEVNRKMNYPLDDLNAGALCFLQRPTPVDSLMNKNTLWGGFGNNFLVRFRPASITKIYTPKLRIKGIRLRNQPVSWSSLVARGTRNLDSITIAQQEIVHYGKLLSRTERDTLREFFSGVSFDAVTPFYLLPGGLELPYEHNDLTFEFNAIEVGAYNQIRYQFKLDGQDENWSLATQKTEATFNNLWEGSYTFNVRYQIGDGAWSEPNAFHFVVRPPLWRTWWMMVMYSIVLGLTIWLIMNVRVRILKNEKRILEKLVSERTREVVSQKEEAERQRGMVEEMNEEIRMQLDQIERDLSEQTLQMIHRHNSLSEIEAEIRNSGAALEPKQLNKLLQLVSINKSLDKEWDTFNNYFTNVHKEFFSKLRKITTGLSIHDQRLAALVRMSLENREIATLLNIEVGSVKVAKYRLKKKLGLSETDDLFQFISSL